MCLEENGV